MKNAVIFDLDGTLLDTLQDLRNSTNVALEQFGYKTRTLEEIRCFVGNGVKILILRALDIEQPEQCALFEDIFAVFQKDYAQHSNDHTVPYDGIIELLQCLKDRQSRMAIVSNKPDAAVKQLNEIYFKDYIEVAIGENEAAGVKKKPAPDTVYAALQQLGIQAEDAIYIGDSEVDLATARNANLECLSVTWGFRDETCLREQGATELFHTPQEVWKKLKTILPEPDMKSE